MWASGVKSSGGGWVGVSSKFRVTFDDASPASGGAAQTKVLLDTADYDTLTEFDIVTNNRFVAAVTGWYHFDGVIHIEMNLAAKETNLQWYIDGAAIKSKASNQAHLTAPYMWHNISMDVYLTASQYVELYLTQYNAGSGAKIYHGSMNGHRFA